MQKIILRIEDREALKNIFVLNDSIGTIYDIHSKHRDSYSKDYIKYVSEFDVNGYTMTKLFRPQNYIWIHVDLPQLRKTVFISELVHFKNYNLNDFINLEVQLSYNSIDGIPVW